MIRRKRWPPPPPGVATDEIICGRTTPFTMAPGNPMRDAPCLACGDAIAGARCYAFVVQTFVHAPHPCGGSLAGAWLIHATCPVIPDDQLAALALARHNQHCRRQS